VGDKMPLGRFRYFLLGLAALLFSATMLSAAVPNSDTVPESGSLAGQLLIASPSMGEPIFYHTVVLIVQHNKRGALGIIINQPFEERSIAGLLEGIGKSDPGVEGKVRIFAGGPMEPGIGFVLHSTDYHRPETLVIDGHIAMTSSAEVLRDIGHKKGPRKSLIAFGYTGWGPGQLEVELARHDWFTIPEDPKLIFDDDRKQVWVDATARLGREL
jgi:putative transcriptional regulator